MKKKVISELGCLGKSFRVNEIKELFVLRIYFDGSFIPGTAFQILQNIEGLSVVGVNLEDRCIVVNYGL